MLVGAGAWLMAATLLGRDRIPSWSIRWLRYSTVDMLNSHFFCLSLKRCIWTLQPKSADHSLHLCHWRGMIKVASDPGYSLQHHVHQLLKQCWCWGHAKWELCVAVEALMGVDDDVGPWLFFQRYLQVSLREIQLAEPLSSSWSGKQFISPRQRTLFHRKDLVYDDLIIATDVDLAVFLRHRNDGCC